MVGSSLYYARCFSPELRRHLKLAVMDHCGFATGNTCTDAAQYAMDLLVGDIERVRQRLDLGCIVMIGHSGHAFMALEYARNDLPPRNAGMAGGRCAYESNPSKFGHNRRRIS